MTKTILAASVGLAAAGDATVFLNEGFDAGWRDRWIDSEWKKEEGTDGKWETSAGTWFGDEARDTGLKTGEDSKFFGISTEFTPFSNRESDLVIQYQMKHDQKIECGGGYIKVGPKPDDMAAFGDPTPYYVMFGPDQCGGTNRIHVILNYKGKNHLKKQDIYFSPSDKRSHLLTLIIRPDNTYTVNVDMEEKYAGNLKEDFDFLEPKEIKDPALSKPADWVDERMIDDPEDTKPEDWVDEERIVDPDATQPEDWDEEEDGEWEAPIIANPEYKGPFMPKRIDNPDYKGEWEHPMIPNPDFVDDDSMYAFDDIAFAGFDLWQVRGGTIFDNVVITNSVDEATKIAEATWKPLNEAEEKLKKEADAEAERIRKEEEAKREAEEEDDLDDLDLDDDDL